MTIGYALLISLLISVSIIPLLSYTFIKTGVKDISSKKGKSTFLNRLQKFDNGVLEGAFKRRPVLTAQPVMSAAARQAARGNCNRVNMSVSSGVG